VIPDVAVGTGVDVSMASRVSMGRRVGVEGSGVEEAGIGVGAGGVSRFQHGQVAGCQDQGGEYDPCKAFHLSSLTSSYHAGN
jgi:hypothetical protein